MTLHRSIFISFGLHLLICGGAFAFAQYGYLQGMRSDTIMVSLVGTGSGPLAREQKREPSRRVQSLSSPAPIQERTLQQAQDTIPAQTEIKHANKPSENAATPGDGGEMGSRAGIFPPNQWQLIQAALERAKNYPRMARERGIEGVVHVRFRILPSGDVERVEILKSSGHAILDSASIKTVYQSRPLPYVTGWVEVPIAYELK